MTAPSAVQDPAAPPVVLLGPQRSTITAGEVVERIVATGQVATITAGWQEREAEIEEIDTVLGGRTCNLALYRRAERAWHDDPTLREEHRAQQQRLALLRRSYNLRLDRLMEAWSGLEEMEGDSVVLDPERAAALEAMRELDAQHLERIRQFRSEFEERTAWHERPAVLRERDEIARDIADSAAVAIAGGHVAVLLNRLRLFGLRSLLAEKPLIAWSAGAMTLSDRVVLFHDTPPQGPGHAEVLDHGLGLARHVVLFPHARDRLRLGDSGRVGRMARRFAPATCVALDEAEGVEGSSGGWAPIVTGSVNGARCLETDGRVSKWAA